jgi:hypothetical protein
MGAESLGSTWIRSPARPARSDCNYTDKLTAWSRVLPKKLTRPQLLKKFPAFYGTLKVHHRIHNSPPRVLS